MFFRYESPCPDVSIYYWPKKLSCPCSTVPRRPVLLWLQGVTWGPVPRPQETCCKGLTAALFIRGIRAVLLAITFWVFFRHALLVAASEQVSGAAPWRQQGFSHLCLLQTSQQLPPGSPGATTTVSVLTLLPGSASVPMGCSRQLSCSSC